MLLKSYHVHPGFGEWLLQTIFCCGALPRRFLSNRATPVASTLVSPSVLEPLRTLEVKTGVRVVDLLLDLRTLPGTAVSTAKLAVFSFLSLTVVTLRVASSLLRFTPTLWDWAALTFIVVALSKHLFRLLHTRSAVALLARTVALTPKQLSLLDLGQHASLYASAAASGAKPSETVNVPGTTAQQPQGQAPAAPTGPQPLTLRRRAASPGRTSLRGMRKGADTLPATGLTSTVTGIAPGATQSPLAAFGASFANQLRQSTAISTYAAGGGDTLDAGRLDSLGLQAPSGAATNALSAAIEAAAAVRQAELAAQQQSGSGTMTSAGGATGGAGNLWDSGFGQMKGLINRLWKAEGDTLLVGGADRTSLVPRTPGAGTGTAGNVDVDALLSSSTIAPIDRSREPYLAAISSPSAFMRRAGDALPILHVSTLRRPLSFDLAGGPLQALDATAATIQRVLHRHFTRVLLEAMRRNTLNLMQANKLLTPAFLTRGGDGTGTSSAAAAAANVVRLPGIRSNNPMTLDELLIEMTTRVQPDSRYLPRRTLSAAALAVDSKPFASTSKPPIASDAPVAGGLGGFSFGISGGVSAQMFAARSGEVGGLAGAAGGALGGTASIAERLAADAKRAKLATDSVVVDLWQERVDLESFLCPPVPVLAAAGVISPAVAAELNVLMSGGSSSSSSSSSGSAAAFGGVGTAGSNALAVLAQVKSYCFSRLAVLLGERNGLSRFLGNTDPVTASSAGGGGSDYYGGVGGAASSAFSGRPSDSLLLLNYLFALMDLEMLRAARFCVRSQQMQEAAAKASGAGEEAGEKKAVSPAAALLQQVANMKLSDRPFSRAHLAYGPIPTPPSPHHQRGIAGALSPRNAGAATAAAMDPRSPLALPELSSAVSGTSSVVAAQRAKIKFHFDLSPTASATTTSSADPTCLIGLTLPALQSLLDRSSVASLLATGSLRAVGGAEAVAQGLGAGPVLDPAAILAAVSVSDICGEGSSSSSSSSSRGSGGQSIASRTVLPRTLALFFLLLRQTYSTAHGQDQVGSPSKGAGAASKLPPLKYCEVPLQWAVTEILHAFVSSSNYE
jgi:hypothetical protein